MFIFILAVIAGLLSIPVAVLFIEVIGGLRPVEQKAGELLCAEAPGRIVVVVPAHNESSGIVPTLQDALSQLGARDRLIVVADNCTDDTGAIAAAAGAEVIVRDDLQKIGKGYAIAWAVTHLNDDPPDFVLFVDADCRIQSGLVKKLRDVCQQVDQPVQAFYAMTGTENSPVNHSIAEFAWILKNLVRPLGLRSFNCPVQLMGSGMMFPWGVIKAAPLASGSLVEDLRLGLDLAAAGKPPYFFPFVAVTSHFPTTVSGTESQRQRWVQGHLGMILRSVPRLLLLALVRRNPALLVLVLDLLVPPLSLLGLLTMGMFAVTSFAVLLGMPMLPMVLASLNLAAFTLAVLLAWLKFGRTILPARIGRSLGASILQKFGIYGLLLRGRTAAQWVRTDRAKLK
ncbi:glycosyltransferase family 2 protein [Bradyrhizobium sp. dw_78]|uniref:glycosyltransferase family 2 protein n=1 Tax=Bradyrhizobium sp. dw_78 TaxID=2719793 RepID=UPI001BD34E69|nr:glycosyltransferase family 2 protein [Bradyrhizobium sp. dw_78]